MTVILGGDFLSLNATLIAVGVTLMAAFPPAESAGEREFHQACTESVRRSLEGRRRLHAQIDALLPRLADVRAQ